MSEVHLDEQVLRQYPHELSGGMLSRALIALALVNHPKVLIADEPTGALDPITKHEVLGLLSRKVREHRMTLLFITHDISAALHMADEIILLREGRIEDEGKKLQYLKRYGQSNKPSGQERPVLAKEW
ncbi:ATP-binding cassette domain-containing protein [Paenibacillus sp. D2_2]|nr:ATP-binding cassette domain-containing protein [Paenibacillus sp. D2_2]WMT40365.1 ATP-binding cassette domain-containing protein [Paenibacillus sp. D2_2]